MGGLVLEGARRRKITGMKRSVCGGGGGVGSIRSWWIYSSSEKSKTGSQSS